MANHSNADGLDRLFVLDPDHLSKVAIAHHAEYSGARPFPHVVLDELFPPELLHQVLEEFPSPEANSWRRFKDGAQAKLDNRFESAMGPITRLFLYQLNSSIFLNFLEELTGIDGLLPDPHFGGGGLHQIERGGFLKIHADFNRHPKLLLDRRLNVLIYLNENWEEAFGGQLELWNREMSQCVVKIVPLFNRMVVFSTTDTSFHGHPDPLTCPEGRSRKSLALYYYTNGRPTADAMEQHSTLFQRRPDEHYREPAATRFVERWLPPAIYDLLSSRRKPKRRGLP